MRTPGLSALQLLLVLCAWRARAGCARCSYTFVLNPASAKRDSEAANASEVAELRLRVSRQEALLQELLRIKEDRTHTDEVLIAQGPGKGQGGACASGVLCGRGLLLQLCSLFTQAQVTRWQQLERKLEELAQLVARQGGVLARLERLPSGSQQQVLPPPLAPVVPISLVGGASNTSRRRDPAPEHQGDQSLRQQGPVTSPLPVGHLAVPTRPVGPWRDCAEAHGAGHRQSGVYELRLGRRVVSVWCEQQQEGGGWTVIQRRQDGSVNFFTNWQHYKVGFGRPDGEYWLGLEPVYQLTSRGDHELLVLLQDWGGRGARAHYDNFSLEPESDHYRLRLGQYHGDAGDSLSWHNDRPFSTVDRDRDSYSGNCALYHRGGWWYHACAHSNLNGVWHHGGHYRSRYQDGVYWAEFRGGAYSLKKAAMLTRLVQL
uniref:Angiopoietin-like 6 n=1 Tax=Nannospalax galili TaxID=1026970 RepID=A0A8C6W8I9_NANGA